MRSTLQLITFLALLFFVSATNAQQINPANIGSVKGLLRDTVHNYPVKSATVSVYRADSTLLNYQLSNNYGEFIFKNLPPAGKFYIEVSHISYDILRQAFTLSAAAAAADLKTMVLKPRDIMLNEVAVSIPPIIMNGDTLEFNAAAFKLDSNAVVEDLLRKIPNVTLWGDGQITVNGREVKSLLVNGKEFFGGDFKIALQNISKNALQKVQVYNVQQNKANPLDSTLTVNLKLKKGKDVGSFGKIGGGYGSNERFEADANINFFTPKLQLGFIGASNNINKIANNVRTLTANSTFKGVGTSVDYQPDFRITGISRTNVGGATFNYEFIEKPTYNKRNTLTANYFVQNRKNDNISNAQTTTTIGTGNKIFDNNSTINNTTGTNQTFDSRYQLAKDKYQFNITQSFNVNTGETNNNSLRSASNQQNVLTSTNNTFNQNNFTNKGFNLNADYNYDNYLNYRQKIKSFNARYSLRVAENDNERTDLTAFRSFIDPASNRDFNRKYTTGGNNINQQFTTQLPRLKTLLFGDKNLSNFDFSISNDLVLNTSKNDNEVGDFNTATGNYVRNGYLSNAISTTLLQEMPGLTITKGFYKGLSNRYNKSLSINLSVRQKISYQDNRSEKLFQNISRNYSNFIPAASLSYYVNQYGEFYNNFTLNFTNDITIPTIEQLAPLTDSTNLYRLQRGNINLTEARIRGISLYFNHSDQRGKNPLNYNMNVSVSFTDNAIVDSSFIDNQNKRTIYLANADGFRSVNANADVRKALKLKANALQIGLSSNISLSKTPGYINTAFIFSNNLNAGSDLSFNYTYKDKIAMEARENINYYRSRQNAFNTNYSGTNTGTTFSGSYHLTKKFTLNSNISFNNNRSSGSKAINYNIWNANAVYRFLKGSNAEFKLSALDLLRQNNSIFNTVSANSFTLGNRNVLQQYFMTTFSYYPRQFGKKAPAK